MLWRKCQKTMCVCDCDCGNSNFIVSANSLIEHNTESCGCLKTPNLIGKRFGKLVVTKRMPPNENKQTYWKCLCDCGNFIELTTNRLCSQSFPSCGCINNSGNSKHESLIASFLKLNNVDFEQEYTFKDCRGTNGGLLRFDFYIESQNLIIEYDGEQHYRPIEYFGGDETFRRQKENDNTKNTYCKLHNIQILRLPYTLSEKEICEKIINSIFKNPVTTTAV